MSAKSVITGGYVRLDIRDAGDFGFVRMSGERRSAAEIERDLDILASAARKRLSKYDDEFGAARVVIERESQCEYCGSRWTESDPHYNGGCCARDEEMEDVRRSEDADRAADDWIHDADMGAR